MGLVAAAIAAASKGSSSYSLIIMVVAFVAIFYFIAIRPQRKQRQKHFDLLSTLKKGDEIVTVGGLYGIVKKIGNDYVEIEIAPRTRVKFLKRAISSVLSEEEDEDVEETTDDVAGEVVDGEAEETEAVGDDDASDSNDEASTKN